MARRRRVYVFDLAAILADAPAPPRRIRTSSLLFAAFTGVLLALLIVLTRVLAEALPTHKLEIALVFAGVYLAVVLIFVAVAVRVHHWRT